MKRSSTYECLDFFVEVGDFEDLLLQLLYHLLLRLRPLLRHVRRGSDFGRTLFVLAVELCVVLSQLPERLS